MQNRVKISVRDRLESALSLLRSRGESATISIVELCRISGVSRANLYANYPDVLDSIRPPSSRREKPTTAFAASDPSLALKDLKIRIKALQYICVELHNALEEARKENDELREELRKRPRGKR